MNRLVALLVALLFASGCGSRRPEAEVARGRQAVVAALDNWKANEPAAKLKSLADPVEFADDLPKTYSLADYSIGKVDDSGKKTDGTGKELIRYTVTLKLKDRKGKGAERELEVVYEVALKSPVVVSRDPMD